MKVLFIGGTGNISAACTRRAVAKGLDVTCLNRAQRTTDPIPGVRQCTANIADEDAVRTALGDDTFDCVVNWVAFAPQDVARDIRLFAPRTRQYIFISSASAYQKPPTAPVITESTPLHNPFWHYAQQKIACETHLLEHMRRTDFPVTIVRPSLTYDTLFPIALGGWGCYTLAHRLLTGQEIVVHGDGESLWTVTHAEDFARGFVPLIGHPAAKGHSFHITSDELLTWNNIYDAIAAALGVSARKVHIPSAFIAAHNPELGAGLIGDKSYSSIFDNSKIRRLVPGFAARIPFHEGVRRTVRWFAADPARQVIDPQVNRDLDALIAAYRAPH